MPVVKVYNAAAPAISVSQNGATRIEFRFLAIDAQGNVGPIGGNLGVGSADIVITPSGLDPIDMSLQRKANGDFVFFVNPNQLALDLGSYPYFIFLNGDRSAYVEGRLDIGLIGEDQYIVEVWNASRNTVLVDGAQIEDPAFASSDSIAMDVSKNPQGVTVIRMLLKTPITDVGVNIDGGAPGDVYPGLPVIDGGAP